MDQFEQRNIDRLSADLLELLGSKGYGPGTVDNYRRILSHVSDFMKRMGFIEYTEKIGEAFYSECLTGHSFSTQWQKQIKTAIRRLNEMCVGAEFQLTQTAPGPTVPAQFVGLLNSYLESCSETGNKETTITGKRRFCGEFLRCLFDAGCNDIRDISTAYICQAILRLANKDSYAVIRSFLRYLYEASAISRDYSGIIPKYHRHVVLPTTYTDNEIRRIEGAIDRMTAAGKRNYAMILLASRLGLRAGDIAGLAFDNINFSRNSITLIQNKTGQPLILPLLPEIREAMTDYIDNARPKTENGHVFVRANAPFERVTTSSIRHSLTACFNAAHIDISGKKHGPRTLRASMATSMVNGNVPYEVVRKALGHANPQAIKHYAKVDIENLRLCAIEVPTPAGAFAAVLQGRARI